ncbi:phosphotransferase [Anaerobacillus sp. MEB173]|uniref:phosphotransferase n=1 Tax=Anaerobacillus sp. MEB173 TaxID=3383345 RepID=UPI003F8FCD7F
MEFFLGDGWQISPAGGATGEAYIAQQGEQKLFIKRNSSPFLAVLSAEGIVPKLLWTKRLENGDVITAQRWVKGRELKPFEMQEEPIAKLLGKIHRSVELLEMFKKIGNVPLTPSHIIEDLLKLLMVGPVRNDLVDQAMTLLMEQYKDIETGEMVVCHCDVNHNNWILSEKDELYLIDWDGARVADRALDLGLLLYWYIPRDKWEEWLHSYGIPLTNGLLKKMHWYVVSETLYVIIWHNKRKQYKEMKYWMEYLHDLVNNKS